MANITAIYTAKRRLRAGITAGDIETITFRATAYDRSMRSNIRTSTAIDGTQQHVTHFINDMYQINTMPIEAADRPKFDEFMYSVRGGESFDLTNVDEDDRVMTCKMQGNFSRSRVTSGVLDLFTYSFSVQDFSI